MSRYHDCRLDAVRPTCRYFTEAAMRERGIKVIDADRRKAATRVGTPLLQRRTPK